MQRRVPNTLFVAPVTYACAKTRSLAVRPFGSVSAIMHPDLRRVQRAIVNVGTLGGRGILVRGGLFVTAAHCIQYATDGSMTLGYHYTEMVSTSFESSFRAFVFAVEPVADVAILGPDQEVLAEDGRRFVEFKRKAAGCVGLFRRHVTDNDPIPVHIWGLDRHWIGGTARHFGPPNAEGATVGIEAKEPIVGGMSGGPIVTSEGMLVGVVSHGCESLQRPPGWIRRFRCGC